jgi:hypothetical protein
MIIKLRHAACAVALLAATAANAATYAFSYHFLNGESVSGSFDGTATGNLVSNVSNVAFSINGSAIGGAINADDSSFSGAAVFSFNGLANNFLLYDSTFQHVLLSAAFGDNVTNVINYATPLVAYAEGPGVDVVPYSAARWNLAAVPEPATYAMLLGGLALLGATTRRRKSS